MNVVKSNLLQELDAVSGFGVTVDQTRQKNREGAGQNSACGLGWSKGIIARGKSAEPTQMEKDFISYGHVQQQREQLERRTQGS
ncbi:hypothetical protein PC114_g22893 [Phytophthora cactorum]|nr:hypothetical protein PC114_g22893 [Phytophthora cactorum]